MKTEAVTALNPKHLADLKSSGISDEIIQANFTTIAKPDEAKKLIKWKSIPSEMVPCWAVWGVDPTTGEPTLNGVQIKPDIPKQNKEGKLIKYIGTAGQKTYPLFLVAPGIDWKAIADDATIDLTISEGAKKAGCLMTIGDAAISVPGVWNARRKDGKGGENLDEWIALFAVPGRKIYLTFDADWRENEDVRRAIDRTAPLMENAGVRVFIPTWDKSQGKGIDDYLMSFDEGDRAAQWEKLKAEALPYEEWREEAWLMPPKRSGKGKQREDKPEIPRDPQTTSGKAWLAGWNPKGGFPILLPAAHPAAILAEEYRSVLAFNAETGTFFRYEGDDSLKGVWVEEPKVFINSMIQAELDARGGQGLYSAGYISSVRELISNSLPVRHWDESIGLLPMKNGVLDLKTKKLLPHAPGFRLTWSLPYDYDPSATCEPVKQWLLESQDNDPQRVQLLRAYLKAIVSGRVDLQRFAELLGKGGTGKGTYTRLAIALVGLKNTVITNLQNLEQNRFETANIRGKRLVVITDSDRYGSSVENLKALTGQDPLRNERKGIQQGEGFAAQAMVIIAANEPIASTDYTSGLERRRMTVPFMHQVPASARRDLLTITANGMSGEFVEYLPGVLNWVLDMPDEEVRDLILNTSVSVPSLAAWKVESLLSSSPIAEWVNSCCIHEPGARAQVGTAVKIRRTETIGEPGNTISIAWDEWTKQGEWLYASYVKFCTSTGNKPVSGKRFSGLVEDLCSGQLKLPVTKGRDRHGAFIQGLRLRTPADEDITELVTAALGANTPECDGSVMDCDGSVTAETLDGDGCDGCDGLFSLYPKLEEINSSSPPPPPAQKQPIVKNQPSCDGVAKNASHPSHPSRARVSAITDPSQTGDRPVTPITIGQRVRVTHRNGKPVFGWSGVVQKVEGSKAMVLLHGEKHPNEYDLSVLAPLDVK